MRLGTRRNSHKPFAILDIGSSKICCMIGEIDKLGTLSLIGQGTHASAGIRAGEVNVLSEFSAAIGNCAGAMHRQRGLDRVGLATANLEAAVRDCAIDEQIGRLHGERLQKVHATQCCRGCRTRLLEVACAREDDAALNDVGGDESVKPACGGRTEDTAAVRRGQGALRK